MYKHEFSIEQHKELLSVIKKSKSKIILSGYDNDLYNAELENWHTAEIETIAQMGLKRTEKIWCNFPIEQQLFLEVSQ